MSETGWGQRPRRAREEPRVYRVGEVNRAVRAELESRFADFWVEGEISEVTRARSGHVYFTLSDEGERAKLSVLLFRNDAERARAQMVQGERVRVRGQMTFYEPTGRTQLLARVVLPSGAGDLAARFEKLRKKLAVEGLLDEARKRPLPRAPRTVGVVTSIASAALHDIVRVAHARAPVRIVVADCRTQGPDAPRSIVGALQAIQSLPELDVIILGRGGGSAEELWAFNHERVARAVASARVPVVCGVGHESDVTIAELVADARASTPSNAAERAVAPHAVLRRELDEWERRTQRAFAGVVDAHRLRLTQLTGRIERPSALVAGARRRLDALDRRLADAARTDLRRDRRRIELARQRLGERDPRVALARDRARLVDLDRRLTRAVARLLETRRARLARCTLVTPRLERDRARLDGLGARLQRALPPLVGSARTQLELLRARLHARGSSLSDRPRARLAQAAARLDALSPLQVLGRGYAIAFDAEGRALTDAAAVRVGDRVQVRLAKGAFVAEAREVKE